MTETKIDWPFIRHMAGRMGKNRYPGSSTEVGWLYQPMDELFKELKGVKVHKRAAVNRDFDTLWDDLKYGIHLYRMLWDIGCSTGYYIGRIQQEAGDRCPIAAGIELDPIAKAIANGLGYTVFSPETIELPDIPNQVILMLNSHMWLEAAGQDDDWLGQVVNLHDSVLYFQTATIESGGMKRVSWLTSEADERLFLEEMFPSVERLGSTTKHGGRRTMWKCATGPHR